MHHGSPGIEPVDRPNGPRVGDMSRPALNPGARDADVTKMTARSARPRLPIAILVALLISALLAPVAVAQNNPGSQDGPESQDDPGSQDAEEPADAQDEDRSGQNRNRDRNDADADADADADEDDTADCGDGQADDTTDGDADADEAADDVGDDTGPSPDPEACAPPQVSLADLVSPAPAAVDLELQAALSTVGFLDTWYSVTSTHPRLSLVQVTSPTADAARTALFELLDELIEVRETTTVLTGAAADATAQRRLLEREVEVVEANLEILDAEADSVEATIAAIEANLDVVLGIIQDAAVGMYVAEDPAGVGVLDDVGNYNDQQELEIQVGATIDELLAQRDLLETRLAAQQTRLAEVQASIDEAEAARDALEARITTVTETIDLLNAQIVELTTRRIEIEEGMPQSIGDVQRERLLATAPGVGVSLVTLDAYVQAADDIRDRYPTCVVRWELLAGIAKVESAHATFGGARVAADGQVVGNLILGPLLDGSLEGTAVIEDTDQGFLDGNDEYDAAVGPFQFIPGTWAGYALDATGDGFADPHNLYDAALSAAGYLCATSDLADDDQIARSLWSYNRSLVYLANVTGFARDYILTLALPQAAYDPERIDARDGWGVHFGEERPYERIGLLGLPDD